MLFEFKSQGAGSVTMTEEVGKQVLGIIGKSAESRGIITTAQMPEAIAALERAAQADLAREAASRQSGQPAAEAASQDDDEDPDEAPVGIHQRIVPFLEMLKEAQKAGRDVMWGV